MSGLIDWFRGRSPSVASDTDITEVGSVDEFVRWVFGKPPADDEIAFYRGHSKADEYKLVPYMLRSPLQSQSEFWKYREMLMANPVDFREDASTFERLSRMQHYGLPTRMLDTSTNPLIALFFACRTHDGRVSGDHVGEVIRFTIPKTKVKYFDSDTVSCLSNLAQMDEADRLAMDTSLDRITFNESKPVTKLLHFIKGEKPYFRDVIEPSDMSRVLCVRGRHSNERVTAQSGAFLLFGQDAVLPEDGNAEINVRRARVAKRKKAEIVGQLDTLAINSGTAFRDIATYAEHIKAQK